jgi:hypothetical protein
VVEDGWTEQQTAQAAILWHVKVTHANAAAMLGKKSGTAVTTKLKIGLGYNLKALLQKVG